MTDETPEDEEFEFYSSGGTIISASTTFLYTAGIRLRRLREKSMRERRRWRRRQRRARKSVP